MAYADKFRDFNADGFFGNHNREELKMLVDFASLSPADQDGKLRSIEKSHFFQLLRQHTLRRHVLDPCTRNAGLIG